MNLSQELTKCGRIYVNPEDNIFFVIDCLFCSEEFCEWSEYIRHIQGDHLQKPRIFNDAKSANWEIESVYNVKDEVDQDYSKQGVKGPCVLTKVLEDGQNNKSQFDLDSEDFVTKELLENEEILDLQIKTLDELNNEEMLEEYLIESMVDNEGNKNVLEANMDNKKNIRIKAKNSTNQNKSIKTCFFRLTTTDSKTMQKFIELLRHHPCQWDHEHPDYTNKDKRAKSSFQLSQELKQHFNLNITPQGTRSSVLTLKRWFDQEYLRFLRCEKKDLKFICTHYTYFKKLFKFLPYKHLKPMTCDECFKHFKSEHLLLAHKHKHHNGEKIPFQCRYCGRGFIHQSLHKMHENRHIKIQLWPCEICIYQATSKADYIKHLETTHSSNRPYKCDICGLVYKTSSNLNVHKKSHNLPQFECEFCKKKFYEKYRYKRHLWLHEKNEEYRAIDNFTCQICGRRFTSNQNLMKHKLVHKEENYGLDSITSPLNKTKNDVIAVDYCDYCSLEFINEEAYKTHMKVKHKIKK